MTVTVFDVAAYILERQGSMSGMKLQKLVYYSQAWHLVWEERPLFSEGIEAWANGPVVRSLYARHRYEYSVDRQMVGGNPEALDPGERETVNVVLNHYGKLTGAELSELTHREAPWRDARGETAPGVPSNAPITLAAMAEYYESLLGTSADE